MSNTPGPVENPNEMPQPDRSPPAVRRRRPRYSGKYPRHYDEKYKERNPGRYDETVQKVIASGKTPAGTHRPIMVQEILEALNPQPGEVVVDCTLGYGGHAEALLQRIQPGGRLIGLDADPLELPKTEARLRTLGFGPETFTAVRTNFAGLTKALTDVEAAGADCLLADLGVSSMQLDNPSRGFSFKFEGPLDLRMNPQRGVPASEWLRKANARDLGEVLRDYADEPRAEQVAGLLAGRAIGTTLDLANLLRASLRKLPHEEQTLTVRRVFQALRIVVNDELAALDSLLRQLPQCLKSDGRVAMLTFHSGEDRRVKRAFEEGARGGIYELVSDEVLRPSEIERRDNPRSAPAKLRVARRL